MLNNRKSAAALSSIVPVDFNKRPRLQKYTTKDGATVPGLYHFPGKEGFYARPYCKGKQREVKLEATTLKYAQMEYGKLLGKIEAFHNGVGPDPFEKTKEKTLLALCDLYEERGFPRRNGSLPIGKQLDEEKRRVENIRKWPRAKVDPREITLEDCRHYRNWRVRIIAQAKRGKGGDRTVDLELCTLSNIFRVAMRNPSLTGITYNPIAVDREKFRRSEVVEHCRDFMPADADELHKLAKYFFSNPETEVWGWVLLFQALVGHRIAATLMLRMDAQDKRTPGFVDGNKLYLYRSKTHKGTAGHIEIYSALRNLLDAHKIWHMRRYPNGNPWYFPAPFKPENPPRPELSKKLAKITAVMGIGKRTSHGLRAYRVNVLRSQGKTDAEIALMIGHKSGEKLILEVYGEGLDYKIGYDPEKVSPAWDKWLKVESRTGPNAEQTNLF